MEMSTGNPLMDCLLLLGIGAGGGYLLKRKSPEQVAAREKESIRQHELEVAEIEAGKVKAANDAVLAVNGQKHESYQKAAEALGKSFQGNPNIDPADAQAAMTALAKNFGIVV
ncbi:MAG: hypothetical protein ACLQPD_17525 [Desulfomonilaceae bacterium]